MFDFRIGWILGVILTMILIINLAWSKEDIRIAFLDKENSSHSLKLYYTVNQSEITLVSTIKVGQPQLVLSSHEPSGIFCWVGKLEVGTEAEIHCYHWGNDSIRILVLPRSVKRGEYESNAGMYIELDIHGKNIYWTDPNWRRNGDTVRGYIWVTSLREGSKDSKVLVARSEDPSVYPGFYFTVDSRNGYILTSHSWRYQGVRILKLWTETPFGEVAGVGQLIPIDNVLGIGVDPLRGKFYWIESTEVYERSLRNDDVTKGSVILSDFKYTVAKEWESSLQYLDDHLYWRSVNGTIFNLDLISNASSAVEGLQIPGFFNVFEDRSYGVKDPCTALACSHLCIPAYGYVNGYKCDCPSDMSLVNERDCQPSALLCQTGLGSNKQLHYPDPTNLGADYKVCQVSPEPKGARVYPQTYDNVKPCPEVMSMDHLTLKPPFTDTPLNGISQVELDPYGIGYLQHSDENPRCIESFNFKTGSSSVALCVHDVIFNFCMDFSNWILFTIESPSSSVNLKPFIIGRNFPLLEERYKFPSLDSARYITVDSVYRKLYWIGEFSTALYSSNYDGGLYTILRPYTGIGNFFNFHENRLLYILKRYPGERFSDSVNSLNLHTNSTRNLVGSTPLSRLCLLIPAKIGEHPCLTSKCSHNCVPHSSKGYSCDCPGYLEVVNDTCTSVDLVGVYFDGASANVDGVSFAQININETAARITSTRTWIHGLGQREKVMLATRLNLEQLCWTVKGNGEVDCVDGEDKVWKVASIHPNSSLLAFDPTGDEIFFNDGHPGNVTVMAIATGSVYEFKSFSTTGITTSVLDTQRKIFFWSNERNEIRFQALNSNKFDGGAVQTSEDSEKKILALTVDTFSSNLYYAQGGAIRMIAYQVIFSGYSQTVTVLKKVNNQFPLLQFAQTSRMQNVHNFFYYKKSLYWIHESTEKSFSIVKLNTKNHNVEMVGIQIQLAQIFPSKASNERFENPCAKSSCSHFCFPENPSLVFSTSYQCACPEGLSLVNERDCIPPDHSVTILISVASATAVLLIGGLITALVWKSRRNVELTHVIHEIRNGNPKALKFAQTEADKAQHLPLTCIIPPAELDVNESKVLGEGTFGLVVQGVYRNTVVALKTLKPSFNLNLLSEFAKEVKTMHYIGYHANIVRFYGAEISNIRKGTFYAVLELSPCGSLIDYLRNIPSKASSTETENGNGERLETRPSNELIDDYTNTCGNHSMSFPMLFLWAKQIATGMAYLAEKSVFHGDLAARNILVFEDGRVLKISDFGFSRQLYQDALYIKKNKCRLPWRWSAIESLKYLTFSTKSDVWSYGVTLWEIFTFGQVPYPEYQWNDKFSEMLENGLVLSKPENVPEEFYENIMKPCWTLDHEKRPDFSNVLIRLQNFRTSTANFPSSVIYEVV